MVARLPAVRGGVLQQHKQAQGGRRWAGQGEGVGDHSPKPRPGPGWEQVLAGPGRAAAWGEAALAERGDDKSQRAGGELSEGRESGAARTLASDVKSSGPRKGRPQWAFKWKRIGQSFIP